MEKNFEKIPESVRERFGIELREGGNIVIPTSQTIIYLKEDSIVNVIETPAVTKIMLGTKGHIALFNDTTIHVCF